MTTYATGHRGGIGGGLRAFLGGIQFIATTPSVWGYALVPVAMMAVLATGFSVLGVWGASHVVESLVPPDVGWLGWLGGWVLKVFLWVAALLLAFFLALSLAQPLSGFALEAIARAQEHALTGRRTPAPSFFAALVGSLKVVAVTLAVGGTVLGGLLVVNFVFPPAAVVTVPLKFVVCAWLLAWDFLDYPLSIRGYGVRGRLGWVARNFDSFTTFGLAWTCLMIVPGMVLLLLPMGVAGATRLVVEDELTPHPVA